MGETHTPATTVNSSGPKKKSQRRNRGKTKMKDQLRSIVTVNGVEVLLANYIQQL